MGLGCGQIIVLVPGELRRAVRAHRFAWGATAWRWASWSGGMRIRGAFADGLELAKGNLDLARRPPARGHVVDPPARGHVVDSMHQTHGRDLAVHRMNDRTAQGSQRAPARPPRCPGAFLWSRADLTVRQMYDPDEFAHVSARRPAGSCIQRTTSANA